MSDRLKINIDDKNEKYELNRMLKNNELRETEENRSSLKKAIKEQFKEEKRDGRKPFKDEDEKNDFIKEAIGKMK